MTEKYALFIGRWQPFHNGHAHIIQKALDGGESVLIGVRDTEVDESNPYTAEERVAMIEACYQGQPVKVMVMPDISSVNIGREVGYAVNRYDAPQNIEGISATKIRRMMHEGDDGWKEFVPAGVASFLKGDK